MIMILCVCVYVRMWRCVRAWECGCVYTCVCLCVCVNGSVCVLTDVYVYIQDSFMIHMIYGVIYIHDI